MNKDKENILELIANEEVEWKKLEEVCEILDSKRKPVSKRNRVTGEYPYYGANGIQDYVDDYIFDGTYVLMGEDGSVMDENNNPILHWVDNKKIWVNNHAHVLGPLKEEYNLKYIYYYLSNYNVSAIVKGLPPKINQANLRNIKIPIPPLKLQEKIVDILDKLTLLQAELQAELQCRTKQYEYYLEKLLTFDFKHDKASKQASKQAIILSEEYIEMLLRVAEKLKVKIELEKYFAKLHKISEVFETITDYVAAGSFKQISENVKYLDEPNYAQLVRTRDIKSNFLNTEEFVYVDNKAFDYLYRVNLDKECIVMPNIGNCGEVYHLVPEKLPYKNNALGPNSIYLRSTKADMKYLYYLFLSKDFQKELYKITSKTGQGKFNKTELKKIKIPVPSIEVQNIIVEVLDKFFKYTNDTNDELLKEIKLRKKEYEYYRGKLLDFRK